jgi:hypothetical protein
VTTGNPATAARAVSLAELAGRPVVGVSLGHPDTVAAEHWLASLPSPPLLACTHLMRSPRPHVALSLVLAAPMPEPGEPCPAAAAEHLARTSGRAVLYPGVERLVGTLTVAEILELSAIDRVEVLGGGAAQPETPVDTGDFVRPQWRSGSLTLTTTPAANGRLVPFETRTPTPCCAAH